RGQRFPRHGGRDRALVANILRPRGERADTFGAAQLDAGEQARFAALCCGTIHQRPPFVRSVRLVEGARPQRKAERGGIWRDFTRHSVLIVFFSLSIVFDLNHAGVEPKDGGRAAFAVPNAEGSAPISKTSSPPPIRSECAIQFLLHGWPFQVTDCT